MGRGKARQARLVLARHGMAGLGVARQAWKRQRKRRNTHGVSVQSALRKGERTRSR
nr:MAG TPA: hypothetical protein [Caudoviricetes sp.]